MPNLMLVPVVNHLEPQTSAVMYEVAAAKYMMLGIHNFRKLVAAGRIPYRTHPGRRRRIYLKSDLDSFLLNLPQGKITASEDSPDSVLNSKGV